ncbi:MAG: cupredoxin domain-containing protein, partial [Chloroflexota bacterium]
MVFKLAVVVVLGLGALIGVLSGRSQSQTTAAPVPTATAIAMPAAGHVSIVTNPSGNAPPQVYFPSVLQVAVGQRVTWTDLGAATETVTADSGAFDSGVLSPGQSFSWTPSKPGMYGY